VPTSDIQGSRPPLRGAVWDAVLNASIPVILYKLCKRFWSPSELTALLVATTFPLGKSIFDLLRSGLVSPISIVVLLGIVTNCVAILLGGSPRLLLLRESLFTGAFGLACFGSLLLPRPMMFYFARHFMAGTDHERVAQFNANWQVAAVRFAHRLVTCVWGSVFVGELVLQVILIFTLTTAAVLVVSPIVLNTLTIVTLIWSFRYAQRIRGRAMGQLNQAPS
jgi:hypothetical protein